MLNNLSETEYGMSDLMPWGQYEGTEIEELVADDPQYLKWLMEEEKIQFDEEVVELVSRL